MHHPEGRRVSQENGTSLNGLWNSHDACLWNESESGGKAWLLFVLYLIYLLKLEQEITLRRNDKIDFKR